MNISLKFAESQGLSEIKVALLELSGLKWPPRDGGSDQAAAAALAAYVAETLDAARAGQQDYLAPRKSAVRNMLRFGAYKPAGRGKPSNEYLLQAAIEGDFPSVNQFVDVVNAASLRTMYPMSVFDADKAGKNLLARRGREGESYVFNSGGQSIELRDLLCLCRMVDKDFFPCVNPVRDSMATKLFPGANNAIVAVYSPGGPESSDLESACSDLRRLLEPLASSIEFRILP